MPLDPAVFQLRDLRLWVMRIHPIVVRSLLRPLAVQLRQLLPCRRCDPRFLGQSPQKLLVALARIPSHNRAHGCVRFQRRAIDAHRLPIPPPATRCHAPPQSLRNIRSAASENTAPASAKDAPSPPRRSAHTAPLQTRRTHAPPAVGSTAGRTDVPPSAAIACGQSKTLPALAAAPLFVPSPCTQFTNLRSGLRKKLHERIQTFTTDC